jgi:ubiquinone/menaquinone biosynthesis C-methylase UbiE
VRTGWDRLSAIYRPDGAVRDGLGHLRSEYIHWLGPLMRTLPKGAAVLDLGCGNGDPAAVTLSKRFRVTGVDISDVQIRRARARVPNAQFRRADMTALRFRPESFQAVVMLYSLIHVPLPKHLPLIRRIARWLSPGGLLLALVGKDAWTGRVTSWLGVDAAMYWSHADAGTYARWFGAAGFRTVARTFVPEGDSGHELFLLQKRKRTKLKGTRSP